MDHPERSTVADMLRQARAGDEGERERLFAACRDYLQLVARSQVESWMRAKYDASDVVQQTLLEAHRDFDRFSGQTGGEWLAWLRRILAHNAADQVRRYRGTAKRQARREVGLRRSADDSAEVGAPEPAAPGTSPSEQVMAADEELRLAAAIARLPPDYQEVVVLRNLEHLAFDEVAERMGRSRPAVQMLWARAVKKLAELLGESASVME